MPLQGTFDVLGFGDVLELLANRKATGRLHVRSRAISTNVYLQEGRIAGADVGDHVNTSSVDVQGRLEEVSFELLEAERGSFEFVPDMTGMGPPTMSLQVEEVLDNARRRRDEWREIQAVIPSLDVHPSVVVDLENEEVTLSRERWRLLTAIDGRRSIRAIARLLTASDYDVCRSVKSLMEVGVVEIDTPARSTPAPQDPLVFVEGGLEAAAGDGAQAPADTNGNGEGPASAAETGTDGGSEAVAAAGTGSGSEAAAETGTVGGSEAAAAGGTGTGREAAADPGAGTGEPDGTAPDARGNGAAATENRPRPSGRPAHSRKRRVGGPGGQDNQAPTSLEAEPASAGLSVPPAPDDDPKGHRQGIIRIGRKGQHAR